MIKTDQGLLAEYVSGHSAAFRELLERHAGMVYGSALRMTGDQTLAEEAAQDVFFLLSRKAAALAPHPCLAGWLHRTVVNVASGMRRGRLRHQRKIMRLAAEAPETGQAAGGSSGEWEALDAAIERLPRKEREVVVLRFFQEMDYTQIGEGLGISEPAARKRLSRGLQRLHQMIGPTRAAMLSPAGLAATVPGGLSGAVMAQLHAAVPPAGLASLFLLMTPKSVIVPTVVLCGSLLWFGVRQWREKQQLEGALAKWQSAEASGRTPAQALSPEAAGQAREAARRQADELETLRTALKTERENRLAAEQAAGALRAQMARLSEEVVVSYGKVSEIGSNLGNVFVEAMELKELEKNGTLDTPEGQIRMARFMEQAGSMSGLSKEIIDFEDKPEEGSQFMASFYGRVFGLEEAGRQKVAEHFVKLLTDAKSRKLTLSNLPDRASPEFGPWLEERWDYFSQNREGLRQTLPEDKQASFDQWVEKGGYGFKNSSLKGMPLMFSLGGDPR